MIIDEEMEKAVALVRQSPDHKVLTRLIPPARYSLIAHEDEHVGVFVDCETTGLDPVKDRVIQIGLVRFTFASDGRIGTIGPVYQSYVDPGIPIPAEITEITGITDAMVKGIYPEPSLIEATLADCVLVLAHNADFDREFYETQVCPVFCEFPWGCSQRDVPWRDLGISGQKLDYLLQTVTGCFTDYHGALADCYAGIHVLAQVAEQTSEGKDSTFLSLLLDRVRRPTIRVMADPPMGHNEDFKRRGYRAKYIEGRFQHWWRDVAPEQLKDEELWVIREMGTEPSRVTLKRILAKDRYSSRI